MSAPTESSSAPAPVAARGGHPLLPVAGLLVLATSTLLIVARGGEAPWPLRLAGLVGLPGTLA